MEPTISPQTPAQMSHTKEMQIVWFIGVAILIAVLSLAITMIGVTAWMLWRENKDVGIVLGLYATIAGIATTGLAYLAPSPLQSAQARRVSDSAIPTGTPSDPISTDQVDNSKSEEIVFDKNNSKSKLPSVVDLTPDDPDLVADEFGEFTELDFEPSELIKRGELDSLDPSYTESGGVDGPIIESEEKCDGCN